MSALRNKRRPASAQASLDGEVQVRQAQKPRMADSQSGSTDERSSDDDADGGVDLLLARKLVRYALSCEYSRTPIRRDGVKERVLGPYVRSYRRVFALAQEQLRTGWGMEMRELPVREKTSLHERRQAMRSVSQPKTGSGAFVLSSTLPMRFRDISIISPSKTPSAEDEAIYVGFYTTIVSLIWLHGGELSDHTLNRYLLRFNADRNVSYERTELTFKRMERQGYVMKKTERAQLDRDGDETVTWHVGPRAKEEIGLAGVMGMVREVYEEWKPVLEQKLRLSLGIKDETVAGVDDGVNGVDENRAMPETEGWEAEDGHGENGR